MAGEAGFNLANAFVVGAGARPGNPNPAAANNNAATGQGPTQVQGTGNNQQQQQQQTQQQSGNQQQQNQQTQDLNLDPNANARNPDGSPKKVDSSPLDAFGDLFKMDSTKAPPADPLAEKLMELDPSKFSQAVSKMDFTRTLPPDLVQKALQGDTVAFNQALNAALQGTFATVVQMMVGINEAAFKKNNQRFDSVLSQRFRNFQIDSSRPENKALQHPAAQPVLAAMRKHIAETSPDLHPREVSQRAEEYFLAMGAAMNSVQQQTQQTGGGGGTGTGEPDWTKFLDDGAKSL